MSSPMAPAGWYDDGQHPGQQRYWDGERWTEHFHPPVAVPAPVPPAQRPARTHRYWAWLAPLLVVVVAGGTVLGLAVGGVFGGNDSPTNAISRLIAGANAYDCDAVLSASSVRLADTMSAAYCGRTDDNSQATQVRFKPTQSFGTATGATVLGVLTQVDGTSSNSTCYSMTTVLEQGRWRVDTIGSDGLPSDVDLDTASPRYCTGTPGLTE